METWMGYFLLGLALSTPIGPVNIEMIRQGLSSGFFSSWLVGLGDVLSNILTAVIILFVFSNGPKNLTYLAVFAIMGGCFLIYTGILNMKTQGSISSRIHPSWIHPVRLFSKGFILGIINPMDFLSWTGVYSTIHHQSPLFQVTAFSYLLAGCGMWNLILSLSVSWCRNYIKAVLIEGFRFISGLILCGYGIFFAWYGLKMLIE